MNDRMDASVAHSTASAGRQRRNDFYSDPEHLGQEWRRLLAEFVGTFALTFVAAGGAVFRPPRRRAPGWPRASWLPRCWSWP
ncbi:MIP/aquaporin family protein [Jatrophihabitans lederbergiae]|uniref:Aquaporin family protein n=1 Tax=Jatrophihabitans lederbergiae TaxID=3075547 RepID=A0ABU2JGQ8_9ACTN|nr:hypothetical protein [Jatrophihabitans sp. DSM 44399]MDT0264176.1 hypothetical protein [Jatrophihabitans sp. DSM 44399]